MEFLGYYVLFFCHSGVLRQSIILNEFMFVSGLLSKSTESMDSLLFLSVSTFQA